MAFASQPVKTDLPKIDYGRGCYLFDQNGKQYIDGSGGPAVYSLGHAHPEVNQAISRQLERIAHGYRLTFSSDPLEELTTHIVDFCGNGLDQVVFLSGGSEANEAAIKIALQFHSARGEKSRRKFIARERSYHGATMATLSLSGYESRREPFEGALMDVYFVGAVNAYRPPNGVPVDGLAEYAAQELALAIEKLGPERIAGFIFEPIVGAAGGCVPAPAGYAKRIREVCDRYGILMIADEVMCGAGRVGTWRALEADNVVPDIMTVAKGLAGGYVPLGATIYRKSLREAILGHYDQVLAGHTFSSHTLACAAGAAIQSIIKRDGLLLQIRENGIYLRNILHQAFGHLPYVGNIRGRGYFWAVEFVRDRQKKLPFDPAYKLYSTLKQKTLERGLICYPNGGNVDGKSGDIVLLAPPFIAQRAELDEIVGKLQDAVTDTFLSIPRR